jgi:hypothetical protein
VHSLRLHPHPGDGQQPEGEARTAANHSEPIRAIPEDTTAANRFRTWCAAGMTKRRYAIESWFFAPSAYPESQTALYV